MVERPPIFALDPSKVISRKELARLEYWIKQGKPIVLRDQIFYRWEKSSVHRTAADGTKTYTEVVTPPHDDADFSGTPLPGGKWGDPKRELEIAKVEFDNDGVLVALAFAVRGRDGQPIVDAGIELDGELIGRTSSGRRRRIHALLCPSCRALYAIVACGAD